MMKRLLFFVFVFFSLTSFAQVKFEAKVSKERLGINERLRVDFEMNQDGDNFKRPEFDGFRIIGGPNQSVSNTWINGKRTYSKTYSFFLAPQKRGKITIGQATIEVEGEVYKTSPIVIEVTEAVEVPNDENNSEYIANESVHLVAEVSNTAPYLNEAITVTYKLYVSYDVNITQHWREIDLPKYADFWNQIIENRDSKVLEGKYKGKDYRYVVLRSVILYPQKSGELEIEPMTLDIPIDVPGSRRDFFGRRISERVNKTVTAGKRIIQVKPLPDAGKPADFSGAVGDFSWTVGTNKDQLKANESFQLDIAISGKGNLKLFSIPTIKLPNALEVYEPEYTENVKTDLSGTHGTIKNSYTVVPQYKGNYTIPSFRFSYFNPKTEQYHTLSSEEINIEVESGPVAATSSDKTNHQSAVSYAEEDFKYIKLEGKLQSITSTSFFKSPVFWTLLGGPFLLIPVFIIVGKKRKQRLSDIEGNRLRKANRMAKRYLSEAKKNSANPDRFYEALERALHNYLRAKLTIETTEMEKSRISTMLADRQVSSETIQSFIELLKSCEYARYASVSNQSVTQDYDKAVAIISEIDKQIQ